MTQSEANLVVLNRVLWTLATLPTLWHLETPSEYGCSLDDAAKLKKGIVVVREIVSTLIDAAEANAKAEAEALHGDA